MIRAFWLLTSILVGCGGASLQTSAGGSVTVSIGGGERSVITLLDVDSVRDVAAGSGRTYVATDRGVLVYLTGEEATASRLTSANGLPSDDVRAVAVDGDGVAIAATARGLVRIREGANVEAAGEAPVGAVNDMLAAADGAVWACGSSGLAKWANNEWTGFGERAHCTILHQGTDGILWAATSSGLLQIEGDVIHEHTESRAMPEGEVRGIANAGPGTVMVLLQGPTEARLGHFDGQRWYGYSLEAFPPIVRGLTSYRGAMLLATDGGTFTIRPAGVAEGARLFPLSRTETRGWRGYRARVLAADAASARAAVEHEGPPASTALAVVPANAPTVDAPGFLVERAPFDPPFDPYFLTTSGDSSFIADENRGVLELLGDGTTRTISPRDLVDPRDLQVASDSARDTWLVTRQNDLVHFENGLMRRVAPPEGFVPQAIATGPQGAYVVGAVHTRVEQAPSPQPAQPNRGQVAPVPTVVETTMLRAYRAGPEGLTQVVERPLPPTMPFTRAVFLGVGDDESFWIGIAIRREDGDGERTRGIAVMTNTATGGLVFHHRNSDPAVDGEGSLQMPDEVSTIDTGVEGYAWLASLTGAIRVGNSQAVVFGEARGVRGEIVSDIAVGNGDRVWIAAAEALGYYENQRFEFNLTGIPPSVNVLTLATDSEGKLYGAGPNGAVIYDGTTWTQLNTGNGLPIDNIVDVEVDAQDRLWLLGEDRVLLFDR